VHTFSPLLRSGTPPVMQYLCATIPVLAGSF
jgi:hypothetical protein